MNEEQKPTEINTVICKVCNLPKTRIEAGKYPNGKIKIYIDENGKKFNGKTCPDCNKTRVKQVMRAGRLGKNVQTD